MAVALIVAAGRGERLGSGGPKALTTLAGRPLLEWSVDALRGVQAVRQIVIALPAGYLDAAPAGTLGVVGGATRSESVKAALAAAFGGGASSGPGSVGRREGGAEEAVIVHDAARALAETTLFEQVLDELERSGADAVIAAAPVSDTIKETFAVESVAGGTRTNVDAPLTVTRTLDRSNLWAVQTPQVFRRRALEQALSADAAMLATATDDAWLIERQGGTVAVLATSPENFKITRPHDLRIAEMILSERLVAAGGLAGGGER